MYNVTLRGVHATTVEVEKRWVLHNLCVFVFLVLSIQHAMRMHHIAPLYNIIPRCPISGRY